MERAMPKKVRYCNTCPFINEDTHSVDSYGTVYELRCQGRSSTGRVLGYRKNSCLKIERPKWCPLPITVVADTD